MIKAGDRVVASNMTLLRREVFRGTVRAVVDGYVLFVWDEHPGKLNRWWHTNLRVLSPLELLAEIGCE